MVIYPDPEALAIAYLDPLVEVAVATRDPDEAWLESEGSFIQFGITGPGGDNFLDEVIFGFTCYAPTTVEAANLAGRLRAHMTAWPSREGGIYRYWTIARPQPVSDNDKRYPAYWFSCSLRFKGNDF